jgi:hypothetical protein
MNILKIVYGTKEQDYVGALFSFDMYSIVRRKSTCVVL